MRYADNPSCSSKSENPCRITSELRVARYARKGYHVTDVLHSRDELHRALEAETEARVRHRAVAAEIQIPPVLVLGQVALPDAALQHFEAVLALRAADDLADPG